MSTDAVSAQRFRRRAVMASLFLVVVFYALLWRDAPVLEGDSPQYQAVAMDLADGRLDSMHFRTPGYPVLLVLTGASRQPTHALLLLSLSLHALGAFALYRTLDGLGASPGWNTLLIGLLSLPLYVEPAAQVMTENLAQFTLVVGLAALVAWFRSGRVVWALVAGLVLSYAALVRPIYQALPLAVALVCLCWPPRHGRSRRPGIVAAAAVLSGWAVLVIGFSTLNYARFGWFGLSPSLGLHLSTKTMGFVERLPDEYAPVRELFIRERDRLLVTHGGTHTGTQAIWGIRDELKQVTGSSDAELSRYLVRMNLLLIRLAPMEYLQEVARSAAVYWFPTIGRLASMDSRLARWLWIAVHGSLVLLLVLQLVMMLAWVAGRLTIPAVRPLMSRGLRHSPALFAYIVGLLIIGYTMALSCVVDIGEPRQRRSTDAVFVFVCVLGLHAWTRAARLTGGPEASAMPHSGPQETSSPRT